MFKARCNERSNSLEFHLVRSEHATPKVGHGTNSQTLNVGVYTNPFENSVVFVDTAGQDEDRSEPRARAWAAWSTATSLRIMKEVRAVVVVIKYSTLTGKGDGRGGALRSLAKKLGHLIGNPTHPSSEPFHESMVFVVSHPSSGDCDRNPDLQHFRNARLSHVHNAVEDALIEEEKRQKSH